jgi:hypothetical protein
MVIILWMLVGVLLTSALVAIIAFRSSGRSASSPSGSPQTVSSAGVATVTLEVDGGDPTSPAVRRLVHETALGIFRTVPDAREVVVRTPAGTILGRVSRETPMPRQPTVSPMLHEPHIRRTHVIHPHHQRLSTAKSSRPAFADRNVKLRGRDSNSQPTD